MSCSKELIRDLEETFTGFSFEFKNYEYSGTIPTFFIQVNCAEKELDIKWKRIVDYIGVHFQTTLENEFSIWNIYLFFILKNKISSSLKYKIENDTFSSRKIVIEDKKTNEEIVNEHIANADLSLGQIEQDPAKFEKHAIIWHALKDKQPQKKTTEKDKVAFKIIVDAIKK